MEGKERDGKETEEMGGTVNWRGGEKKDERESKVKEEGKGTKWRERKKQEWDGREIL